MKFLTENSRELLSLIRCDNQFLDEKLNSLSSSEFYYLKTELYIRKGEYSKVDGLLSVCKDRITKLLCLSYRNLFTNTSIALLYIDELLNEVKDTVLTRRLLFWKGNILILSGKIDEASDVYSSAQKLRECDYTLWEMEEYSLLALFYYISGDSEQAVEFHNLAYKKNLINKDYFLNIFNSAMAIRLAIKIADPMLYDKYLKELELSSKDEFKRFKLRQFGLRAIILLQNGDKKYAKHYWNLADKYLADTESPFEAGQYLILRGIGAAISNEKNSKMFLDRARLQFENLKDSLSYIAEIELAEIFSKIANPVERGNNIVRTFNDIIKIKKEVDDVSSRYPDYLSYYFSDAINFCDYILEPSKNIEFKPKFSLVLSILFNCNALERFEEQVSEYRIVPDFVSQINESNMREETILNILTKTLKQRVTFNEVSSKIEVSDVMALEIPELKDVLFLGESIIHFSKKIEESIKETFRFELSRQLAHDIRSPLAALDSTVKSLEMADSKNRQLVRSAINRIHDIANNLIGKTSSLNSVSEKKIVLLTSLLSSIASEKRTEFRSINHISIDYVVSSVNYGLFSFIEPNELKRVISNLVNNSVEANDKAHGYIEISLKSNGKFNEIIIVDNGKGIPTSQLNTIFNNGVTFNKVEGTGLGLFYAKKIIESWNGNINCKSIEGVSTEIIISIPISHPPKSFAEEMKVSLDSRVIVVDDDSSIHQVWLGRFESLNLKDLSIISFSDPDKFLEWYNLDKRKSDLFLVDYEFIGHSLNGLDLMDAIDSNKKYLITSRYEENHIKDKCDKDEIQLIDKGMIGFIPINILEKVDLNKTDIVFIDDDSLMHMSWTLEAKKTKQDLKCFSSIGEFLQSSTIIEKDTPIYIDSNLANNIKGEVESEKIYNAGFTNLYLATGYSPDDIEKPEWIKEIVGKRPPFNS